MEIGSGYMKPEQVWEEVQEIVTAFQRLHVEDLTVFYGFNCDCEINEQYQDIGVKTDDLLDFLSQSMAQGTYRLADADFHIESHPSGTRFLLCHESDVHLETDDGQVADHFRARWSAKENPGYEKHGETWMPLPARQALEGQNESYR